MIQRILLMFFLMFFSVTTLVSCSSSDKGEDTEQSADAEDEDFDDDEDFEDDDFADGDFSDDDEGELADEDSEESEDELLLGDEGQDVASGEADPEAVIINNISFKANESGGTVLVETTGEATYASRLNSETKQFILEIQNATLPNKLKRPFITTEFGSEFKSINAYQNPGGKVARIVIQLGSNVAPMVQAEGNSILVVPTQAIAEEAPEEFVEQTGEVAQPEMEQVEVEEFEEENTGDAWSYNTREARKDSAKILSAKSLAEFLENNTKFYGRRISIETAKNTDVRDIIEFISEQSGVNMVISEDVQGTIQLKLRQVPWDQAFVIVLKTKGLGYVRQGNVIRIATLNKLEQEATQRKKVVDANKELEEMVVKVLSVNFASVDELKGKVAPFLTKDRGSATTDKRTSSIIVKDTPDNVEKITSLVRELDVPPSQVMIEAKVVEASENFENSFGINWGYSGSSVTLSETGGANGVPIEFDSQLTIAPLGSGGGTGVFSLNVGTLDFLGDLSTTLAIEENEGNVKVIASPRILTLNNEAATITQSGEVLSLKTTVSDGVTTDSVERVPFSLNMNVTPQITSSGAVIMQASINRSFPGAIDDSTKTRAVNTRSANTKIMVQNGQTGVIGGIFQNDVTTSEQGIPVLKDIPVLGWLFKSKAFARIKTELLLFLTPRILEQPDVPGIATAKEDGQNS